MVIGLSVRLRSLCLHQPTCEYEFNHLVKLALNPSQINWAVKEKKTRVK